MYLLVTHLSKQFEYYFLMINKILQLFYSIKRLKYYYLINRSSSKKGFYRVERVGWQKESATSRRLLIISCRYEKNSLSYTASSCFQRVAPPRMDSSWIPCRGQEHHCPGRFISLEVTSSRGCSLCAQSFFSSSFIQPWASLCPT